MTFLKLIDYFAVFGLVIFLTRVALPKVVLGAILSILAALWPSSSSESAPGPQGSAILESARFRFDFRGSPKLVLALCGLVLVASACLEHYPEYARTLVLRQSTGVTSQLEARLQEHRSQRCAEAREHADTPTTPDLDAMDACDFLR